MDCTERKLAQSTEVFRGNLPDRGHAPGTVFIERNSTWNVTRTLGNSRARILEELLRQQTKRPEKVRVCINGKEGLSYRSAYDGSGFPQISALKWVNLQIPFVLTLRPLIRERQLIKRSPAKPGVLSADITLPGRRLALVLSFSLSRYVRMETSLSAWATPLNDLYLRLPTTASQR